MVIARNLVKEARTLKHLEAYIPTEVQRGYNDSDNVAGTQHA
jgi:hypothetical protein